MIITFIITSLITLIAVLITPIPTLPDIPTAISDAGDWLIDQVESVVGILNLVYGHTLLVAIMVVVAGMFSFTTVYHSIMWIVRKIPIINVK